MSIKGERPFLGTNIAHEIVRGARAVVGPYVEYSSNIEIARACTSPIKSSASILYLIASSQNQPELESS